MSTIADRLKNLYDKMVIANSVTNEFTQALPDCYDAVEAKGGTLPAQETAANLPSAIASIPSGGSPWSGHVDEAGLRAIGWTDRDIEWLNNVKNWNEDSDDVYKVPQELIDAYIAAGNTWNESLSQTYAGNWWFRYRPRGGENGSFANSARCDFLIAIPNYEIWPWAECRGMGRSASFFIANNLQNLAQQIDLWDYSAPIIYINTTTALTGMWSFLRNNTIIREIHGILDFSLMTGIDANYTLNSCQNLRIIWIKNLVSSIRIMSYVLAKECVLYMINNEAASSAITITIRNQAYNQYAADADIVAALSNHPNVTLAGV